MATTITVKLPEDVLIDALRQLPSSRRRQLLQELASEGGPIVKAIPASELDRWTGFLAVGGDALTESEQLYDD
jgi:hypothetical protein